MPVALRPYQTLAVDAVRGAYHAGHRAPLLVAPTGAGKTVMFSYIASESSGRGKRVLIVAHRKELIRQASEKLRAAGVRHGIIAPWADPDHELVQVASVQTLARRLTTLPRFDLIVLDEAHHAVAGTWAKVVAAQPWAKILGVTATPERMDGRGLGVCVGGVFDTMVLGPTITNLVGGGFLTPTRVFAPDGSPDLSGVRTVAGDYDAAQVSEIMTRPQLVGDCVEHYREYAAGLPTIAFCRKVADAKVYAEAFRAAGWRSLAAYGDMPGEERDAAIAGLATGAVQVLTTCDLISEGLDVPAIGAVILLRPTKSLGLHVQQVGRGLRPMPGKTHLIVLDHAGNTYKHGLPDADHEWSLEGRPKKGRNAAPAAWRCSSCFAMNAGRVCLECGAPMPRETGVSGEGIDQIDGRLVEVDPMEIERQRRLKTTPLSILMREAQTREQIQEIGKLRGYKPGWIHRVMEERARVRGGSAAA